jgi:hypothetical protein
MREKITYFTYFSYETYCVIRIYSDETGRIIAAVFEIFETLVEVCFWRFNSDVSDDSTHMNVIR